MRIASAITPRWFVRLGHRIARAFPALAGPDHDGLAAAFASLDDGGARGAFAQTVRGTLSWSGQRLEGTERFYLLAGTPVLLVGGSRDSVIPLRHTLAAYEALPASRLDVFDGAGHFPHVELPHRFAATIAEFLASTDPAQSDRESLRRLLLANNPGTAAALTSPANTRPTG
ncbi:alpha/beta fold hydrolase [Pseudonocardia sp. TRM90224]|uniref:alpha/beta fold hydrolase n=1 Tax=Pseudonocardia sp. TRM90224 TaxID=2812678 RepID=UPI001E3CAD82|nr:alpha/beta fold hydrolase [Pseudonocardia sp. TRM90224]